MVISLPKLKTHHWAGATLSLKNLFGTLPGICYGWPKNELHWRGIDNSIVDIALTRTPDLAIVDGIIGMEGDGPLNGTAKHMGVLVMGNDLLAVDATCCRLMELDPERIGYLVLGRAGSWAGSRRRRFSSSAKRLRDWRNHLRRCRIFRGFGWCQRRFRHRQQKKWAHGWGNPWAMGERSGGVIQRRCIVYSMPSRTTRNESWLVQLISEFISRLRLGSTNVRRPSVSV